MLLKQVMEAEEQLVPPLATGRAPGTPVVKGRPVKLVATPDAGVPRAGAVRVGEVRVLLVRVWVAVRVTTVSDVPGKAKEVESVPVKVRELDAVRVLPSAIVRVEPVAGVVIVSLLMEVAVATPNTGVTSVGLEAKTRDPVPVWLVVVRAVPPLITKLVEAMILVAVRVSVAKVRSASSESNPAVPAKVILVAVSPESVMLPPTRVV